MAVVINGTTGVSGVDGSAGTPSYQGADSNTGIFFPAADTIAFAEGGAEAMRIDSSGNVGIGTSALNFASGGGLIVYNNGGQARLILRNNLTGSASTDGFQIIQQGSESGNTNVNFQQAENSAMLFSTNATERMRIDSSGNVLVNTTTGYGKFTVQSNAGTGKVLLDNYVSVPTTENVMSIYADASRGYIQSYNNGYKDIAICASGGNVGIGTSSPAKRLDVSYASTSTTPITAAGFQIVNTENNVGYYSGVINFCRIDSSTPMAYIGSIQIDTVGNSANAIVFGTRNGAATVDERARITSGGDFLVAKTSDTDAVGFTASASGYIRVVRNGDTVAVFNRATNDGTIVSLQQDAVQEGTISVSGNTVSYNGFSGGHWTQLPEGRGYNPEILRGTVMSSIGEMCEWKSVTWTETIEHPAVPAVDAKDAVLDEEGNVIEPAIEAIEGKDAWTETINKREAYLGQLPVGATFEEDGVTKTVVDDGNERLPKVKISDVVGDKAVYGVFQTWDEVQDMLVTSLGAFVVRIAAGVTVQIGDLLESNGDGCAKVQDDDVIRSKTIGKVTSTTPTATYDDGSYTVPCVIYCG